ncbi:MAG TPA: hypothetical protein VIF15_15365, partial [Polyangiaceae bacterium]
MSAGSRTGDGSDGEGRAPGGGRGGGPFRGSEGGAFDALLPPTRDGEGDGDGSAGPAPLARAVAGTSVGASSKGVGMWSASEGIGGRTPVASLCSPSGLFPA